MTITYFNGTVLQATMLAHDQHEIRAVAPGAEDVLVFTRIGDTWISEELEPVTIELHWQCSAASGVPSVDDCICPTGLADYLICALLTGDESDESGGESTPCFQPGETSRRRSAN